MSEQSGGTGGAQADGWAAPDSDSTGSDSTGSDANDANDVRTETEASPVVVTPPPTALPPHFAPVDPSGRGGKVPMILWIAISVVLAGMVGTLVVWGVLQMDQEEEELIALGDPIVNASEELQEAEESLRDDLDMMAADPFMPEFVTDGSVTCWYSYPEGEDEPNDLVRCGPIAFADSPAGTFWLTGTASFSEGPDGTVAAIEGLDPRRTSGLEEGEVLRRPDGQEAPRPESIDIMRPPAHVSDDNVGVVGWLRPIHLPIELRPIDDVSLRGLGYTADVTGQGTTDRVQLPYEDQGLTVFAAPDGHEWLLFTLEHEGEPVLPDGVVTYSLTIDGETHPIDDNPLSTRALDSDHVFAALVPQDAGEIALVVSDDVLEQSWSFTSESLGEDAAAILYRDPETRAADGGSQTVPYTVTDRLGDLSDLPEIPEPPPYDPEPIPTLPPYEPEPIPTLPPYEPEPIPTLPPYEPEPLPTLPTTEPPPTIPLQARTAASTARASQTTEEGELTVSFTEAQLHYAVYWWDPLGNDVLHTPSGPDRALLSLADLEATWSVEPPWIFTGIRPGDITLVLEDGTEADVVPLDENYGYTALDDSSAATTLAATGFREVPVWDVPADIDQATVRITPSDSDPGDSADFDYHGATIELTLNFGE